MFRFAFIAATAAAVTCAEPLLGALQADGLAAPLAAGARPRFSWRVGGLQTSFRLRVQQLYPSSSLLWDSGVIASNDSYLIPFGGAAPPRSAKPAPS